MIAIHDRKGSFSDQWKQYCIANVIPFRVVDCYASDIVEQLQGCDALFWHWSHSDYRAALFARQLTQSLEQSGIRVFPDSNTAWHYDDKIGQKYLFEAMCAPLVRSYVFYEKKTALEWVRSTSYPKIFKLRGGAGSENVKLVANRRVAESLVRRAFKSGFRLRSRKTMLQEHVWRARRDHSMQSILNVFKGLLRLLYLYPHERLEQQQKGYAYFQDFIPNNEYDIRVVVIGKRAFAIKRLVRQGDFRASGSGLISYNKDEIPTECVRISFDTAQKMKSQCSAFDFVFDAGKPLIVEVSYAFTGSAYRKCPGWWGHDLRFREGEVVPENIMMEEFFGRKDGDANL